MEKINIPVDPKIRAALLTLANQEFRDPRYQATVLIRDALIQRGLLPSLEVFNPLQGLSSETETDFHR